MLKRSMKPILLLSAGIVIGLAANRWWNTPAQGAGGEGKSGPQPATEHTKQRNADFAKTLPFKDTRDFDYAKKGLIAPLPNGGVIKDAKGNIVWDLGKYAFVKADQEAQDSVNPSLWRQAQVMLISGLFKVTDNIYQVRGIDLSNITFIE